MHKRYAQGFTLVELMTTLVVIGIITSVGILSYIEVQAKARDDKRRSDVTVLVNELERFYERNGEYPPGCPDASCPSAMHTTNVSIAPTAPLSTTTTLTTLSSILPGIRSTFGDPQSPNKTLPFKDRTVAEKKYIYFGGTVNYTGVAATLDSVTHTNFPCTLRSSLAAGQVGSYVVGYYSERTKMWVLTGGRDGIQMTIAAGLASDGCVINRS